ncbi:MAG: hypothetical protein U9R44_05900 [Candidatus Omnitrophota bacterium]|nr:hypothetical protein [Candidatus Omnitrophota bacterium]
MEKKKKFDKIDLELFKTYFRNTEKEKKPAPAESPPVRPPVPRGLKVIGPFIGLLAAFLALMIYLSAHRTDRPEKGVSKKEAKTVSAAASTAQNGRGYIPASVPSKNVKTLYDFEIDNDGWEIPAWELEKTDHVARWLKKTKGPASKGNGSLELCAEFPGQRWTAALAEIQQYLDLREYGHISVDIYLPPDCPAGLRGKLILTVGEDWRFVEMARSVRLEPGSWTTISADLSEQSIDWKRAKVDDAFKGDVRKIAVRIESNKKPAYSGPVYIDNISVYSKD